MKFMYFSGKYHQVVDIDEIEKDGLKNILSICTDPNELEYRCRSTGDQSFDGIDLFEGHIVVDGEGDTGVIVWIPSICQFTIWSEDSELPTNFFTDTTPFDVTPVKIIGHVLNDGDRELIGPTLFSIGCDGIKKY